MNIFMHGVPGSGKTSLISAVATEFGLSLVVVPFRQDLTVTDDRLFACLNEPEAVARDEPRLPHGRHGGRRLPVRRFPASRATLTAPSSRSRACST